MTDRVLVVGAGIGGLAVAAGLSHFGIAFDVVERDPGPRAAGAGIALHPNAIQGLARLGVTVGDLGFPLHGQLNVGTDGIARRTSWANVWDGELPVGIDRRMLAGLLLDHIAADCIRWGTVPIDLRQDDIGVDVAFSDGSTSRYAAVIGSDGVRSWVRAKLWPEFAGARYLGQMYWRAVVPGDSPYGAEWTVHGSNGRFVGVMPLSGQRHHVFMQLPFTKPLAAEVGMDTAELRERAAAIQGGHSVLDAVRDGIVVHRGPAHAVELKQWCVGRVGLLGDAAHAMSPSASQGGAMSIEDAVVLCQEIRASGPGPVALEAYRNRRSVRVTALLRRVRLNLILMERMGSPNTYRSRAGGTANADSWYRELYRPLLVSV